MCNILFELTQANLEVVLFYNITSKVVVWGQGHPPPLAPPVRPAPDTLSTMPKKIPDVVSSFLDQNLNKSNAGHSVGNHPYMRHVHAMQIQCSSSANCPEHTFFIMITCAWIHIKLLEDQLRIIYSLNLLLHLYLGHHCAKM